MSQPPTKNINYLSYIAGFMVSIFLTVEAYLLVVNHVLDGNGLAATLVVLAVIQFMVQMFFFLHLGQESKPRWRLLTFGMMLGVVLIMVLGSLWIMHNLNYSHKLIEQPNQVNKYLDSQDGL